MFSTTEEIFNTFQPISFVDAITAIRQLLDKQFSIDPISTSFIEAIAAGVSPFSAELLNHPRRTRLVLESFTAAHVTPDTTLIANENPIDSLRICLWRPNCSSGWSPTAHWSSATRLQPAYWPEHLTETAVIKVPSNILLSVDVGELTATFVTIV
jgi:hypothetical protein